MTATDVRTISLHAANLGAVIQDFRTRPLDHFLTKAPRGRLAAVLSAPLDGVIVDGSRVAAKALAGVGALGRRAIFDALVEDLALASVFDAAAPALAEVMAAAAKLAGREELAAARLDADAAPAYPPELLADAPGAVAQDNRIGLVTWLSDATLAGAAAVAVRKLLEHPPDAFPSADPSLFRDLAESLVPVFRHAATAGHAVVAQRA